MKINKINVKIFKIKNRRDYAALFANHLTEGKTPQQTFERMVKAATIFLLFLFIFSCLYNPCYAAPAYGVKMPDKNHFFFGLQSYSLLKKQLEADNGKMCSLQHFFLITYGLSDWFSIDLKGGGGNIKQSPDVGEKIKYASYLGGGYGFRIRLYEKDAHKAVFGFQHISIHPHKTHQNNQKHKAVLDDWQFSLLFAHKISILTPYIGTRWSRMDYIHWVDNVRNRVKSDRSKSIGLIAGTDIALNDTLWLNLEGNFLDAAAASLSINYKF